MLFEKTATFYSQLTLKTRLIRDNLKSKTQILFWFQPTSCEFCFFVSLLLCDYLLHFTNLKKKPLYQWSSWARMHIGGRHLARNKENSFSSLTVSNQSLKKQRGHMVEIHSICTILL